MTPALLSAWQTAGVAYIALVVIVLAWRAIRGAR